MRRNSRDLAFKLIYESFFLTDMETNLSVREDELINYSKDEITLAMQLFEKYNEVKTVVMSKIENSLVNYTLNRVYKIDLALLCLMVVEIDYFETPIAVACNEAIELSKVYSTEKSPKFLNGIIKTLYGEGNDR